MLDDAIDAEQIGPEFVPRLREPVAAIPVADEAVLYEEDIGRLHQLNPTGAAVCGFIDGDTPLESMIGALASRYGMEPAEIRDDVVEMVRALGRKGLLNGVRTDEQA